ncbi:hypothetical protein Tco_1310207 [Tanacetum coccineum]
MHNNIMAAGSKDRPPMLGPGRYSQWRSHFLWYIDTKPNGEGLRKSILSGPYVPSTVLVQAVAATEGNPAIQQHTTIETVLNMTPENKEHFLSEKEAIFLLLTGIGDDIYSTVDACKTANEMWIAIERLQQGESLNVQDVKTNLFWEFGKFTSRDGESMESYYSRFYKLMNEFKEYKIASYYNASECSIFFNQLQPEWSRFVTVFIMKEDSVTEQPQRDQRNANEFGTPCKSGQFGNQRTMTVAGARETVGSQIHGGSLLEESSSLNSAIGTGYKTNDENNMFANERQHSEDNLQNV